MTESNTLAGDESTPRKVLCTPPAGISILMMFLLGVGGALGQGKKPTADLTMKKVVLTSDGVVEVTVTNDSTTGATLSMNVWGGNECPQTLNNGAILVTPSDGPTNCEVRSAPGASITLEPGDEGTLSADLEVGPGVYLVFVDAWASTKGSTSKTKRGVAVGEVR